MCDHILKGKIGLFCGKEIDLPKYLSKSNKENLITF